MSIAETIKGNSSLKKVVHYLLVPPNQARPRRWVKWLVNPFFHRHKNGAVIRKNVRLDVFPFNSFVMGKEAIIESFSTINNGVGAVVLGDFSLIGIGNVFIGPVEIGNNVICAQYVVASGLNHEYKNIEMPIHRQRVNTKKIIIEDECWIGAHCVITAGVTIGRHSVVAAGSVVTKDIPAYSVAAGNPARVIKQYDFQTKEWCKV